MKTNVIIAALLIGASLGQVSAQSGDASRVPQAIKTAFMGKYATAKHVKWDKEGKDWEASFQLHGQQQSAVYTAAGQQTESELDIAVVKLPETVRSYMKAQKKTITEAAEITDAVGKKYYEAEAGGKDYLFNSEGKPVKKIGDK